MIQSINPKINEDNLTDYFKQVRIVGDGNCGIYSIIYSIRKFTTINTFDAFEEKIQDGMIYYDEDAVKLFRKDMYNIYDEKIRETKSETTKQKYKKRQKEVLQNYEWLIDDDIQFYGEKYELCIFGIQIKPFRKEFISNGRFDWVGFDKCPNTIFLFNRGGEVNVNRDLRTFHNTSSTGIHFEALEPIKYAKIYKMEDHILNSSKHPSADLPKVFTLRESPSGKKSRRNREKLSNPYKPSTNLLLGALSVFIMVSVISIQ